MTSRARSREIERRTSMKQAMRQLRPRGGRLSVAALAAAGLIGAVGACSGDDDAPDPREVPLPTGAVRVEVSYPDAAVASVTAVLHAWVLAERAGAQVSDKRGKFNCASLVGGSLDPYDLSLIRRADVAVTEDVTKITAEHVAPGDALVYVEAGGFDGVAELAGCAATSVSNVEVSASLSLSRAKVFDCSDPDTEDGSPCDDGLLCTVGETCDGGSCGEGIARDCGFAADGCNAGSCDEARGCVVAPLANGTPCDDDLFCTGGDVCNEGECVGSPRSCAEGAAPCQVPVGCDEVLDRCVMTDAPFGTSCDDGLFCTETDQCDSFGSCSGTTRDCSLGVPQCQASAGCDETADACATVAATPGTSCDDTLFCTVADQCDGLGACIGSARDCSGVAAECEVGVCDESLGSCEVSDAPLATPCDDAFFCTVDDACDGAGSCLGSARDCSGLDPQCDPGSCDELGASCEPAPLTGPTCDDGDALTSSDQCTAGTCVGS